MAAPSGIAGAWIAQASSVDTFLRIIVDAHPMAPYTQITKAARNQPPTEPPMTYTAANIEIDVESVTGLDLYTATKIANQHGGIVYRCYSAPDSRKPVTIAFFRDGALTATRWADDAERAELAA
jgi:hypothetical protein